MAEEIQLLIQGEDSCRNGADEAGRYGNDVVVDVLQSIDAKLASQYSQDPPQFTICGVPRDIRKVDNDAYDPLVVSIGPYHRGNPNLHDMEEVKWRNLKRIRLEAGNNFKEYLKAMEQIEPRARKCYSGNINMEVKEFIEMMLLDGLFIIHLLLDWAFLIDLPGFHSDDKDPIYTIRGMLYRVGHDVILLENQLPFFVLDRLWQLACKGTSLDLLIRAFTFIRLFALHLELEWDQKLLRDLFTEEEEEKQANRKKAKQKVEDVHHLLHLAHLLLKPSPTEKSQSMAAKLLAYIKKCTEKPSAAIKKILTPVKKKTLLFLRSCRCNWFPLPSGKISSFMIRTAKLPPATLPLQCFKSKNKLPPRLTVIPSATTLAEAGVNFQCVYAKSFLDITFVQGTMKIPRLSMQDVTIPVLRNFIAFEQCFPNWSDHFTSYCSFMDYLINTPRDVEILTQSQIIENRVGSDEEVALIFNNLCKGIFSSDFKRTYLAKSFERVTMHTQKTWPKWRAKLVHDYFSSPWSIISFIAATFAIVLTFLQTYAAFT